MSKNFVNKYRPKTLEEIVGQPIAVKQLTEMISKKSIPHCLLLTGPSGVGKTTTCKFLRKKLKARDTDYQYINCASSRGIDMVRGIDSQSSAFAMHGGNRLYVLDECHQLSKEAMSAFLIITEEAPDHVYFIFATTHPQGMIRTLLTRCSAIDFRPVAGSDIRTLLTRITKAEKAKSPSSEVIDRIIKVSDGSARMAVQQLEKVLLFKKESEQLEALANYVDSEAMGIELIRYITTAKGASFEGAMEIQKRMETTDIEGIRRGALGYAGAILRNGCKYNKLVEQCGRILRCFRDNFYDSGRDGLTAAIWEVMKGELP